MKWDGPLAISGITSSRPFPIPGQNCTLWRLGILLWLALQAIHTEVPEGAYRKGAGHIFISSTNNLDTALLFDFLLVLWLGRKLQYTTALALGQISQKHRMTIGEFEGVVMAVRVILIHLPEDSRLVAKLVLFAIVAAGAIETNFLLKGELCAWDDTYCRIALVGGSEATSAAAKVARYEGFVLYCSAGFEGLKAKVANRRTTVLSRRLLIERGDSRPQQDTTFFQINDTRSLA